MPIVVPYAVDSPKTRLEGFLTADERKRLARAMLEDVLETIQATGREPTVLATAPLDVDVAVCVDDRPLTEAVNAWFEHVRERECDPTVDCAVVMADLGILTPETLDGLFEPDTDVVLAPGRGGGTNAVVSCHPAFTVDYHGASFCDHRRIARQIGASVAVVDSFRLSTDIDEPEDLVEVLLHGSERARTVLEDADVVLRTTRGRVTVERR